MAEQNTVNRSDVTTGLIWALIYLAWGLIGVIFDLIKQRVGLVSTIMYVLFIIGGVIAVIFYFTNPSKLKKYFAAWGSKKTHYILVVFAITCTVIVFVLELIFF